MAAAAEISWFKRTFASDIVPALAGTPISIDMICALAFQESGELWSRLRRNVSTQELLRLSCGDTLDYPNRSAFPRNQGALLAVDRGDEMFQLAHRLLEEMAAATGIETYLRLSKRPEKFLHGYGVFQYDLQFFKKDPAFFLEQKWTSIAACLEKLLGELKDGLKRLGYAQKPALTDLESSYLAIVYNTGFGNFKEERGLRQGYFDGNHYYGENIYEYIQVARAIDVVPAVAQISLRTARDAEVRPSAAAAAKAEFARYKGIDEGQEPLRTRIADYYEAGRGSRNLDPTRNENAWSAAFVSYCIKQSGATADQFAFSLRHSVFVHDAIKNTDMRRGVFRGYPISDYAPKLGDIVHHNRGGANLSFEFARANSDYPSHSAIVVDFVMQNGVRHAVTVGGNEALANGTGTVGQKFFPLDANGFLNPSATTTKFISIIENRLEGQRGTYSAGAYVVRVRTDLKLRGGPGAEFPIIKALTNDTALQVIEFQDTASGRWALVDLEGDGIKDGFVFAAFIEPLAV